jgi:hypothetical protein
LPQVAATLAAALVAFDTVNASGQRLPMTRDPRVQGNEFVRKLISRLSRDRCSPPAYGVATCFPDIPFDTAPGEDDLTRTTIGRQDLPWLDERLKSLLDRVLPPATRAHGRWIERLHELWGDTWIPTLKLGTRSRIEESERAKLDAEQARTIQMVERNSNLLIEGGAGTGKTLLAREAACRLAAKGERVLLACFTNALAEWLRRTIAVPNVRVSALGQLALAFLRLGRERCQGAYRQTRLGQTGPRCGCGRTARDSRRLGDRDPGRGAGSFRHRLGACC